MLSNYEETSCELTFDLKLDEYEPYLYFSFADAALKGIQHLYRFDNGFGASVIKNKYSYGHQDDLWELALVCFEKDGHNFKIYKDMEPIGYLTPEEVAKHLEQIKEMNPVDYEELNHATH